MHLFFCVTALCNFHLQSLETIFSEACKRPVWTFTCLEWHVPSQFQRQSPPASNKRWVLWIPIFQALHTEWAGPVPKQKKNRPLTGRYTLGDRAISTTQNRCGLLNALGGLTFYRLLNTEQKIFPRKGLITPVINLQVQDLHVSGGKF